MSNHVHEIACGFGILYFQEEEQFDTFVSCLSFLRGVSGESDENYKIRTLCYRKTVVIIGKQSDLVDNYSQFVGENRT